MVLGKQIEWAMHCASFLASLPEDMAVSVNVLAEYHEVPRDYLAKALQSLAKAGIVKTTVGPRGGYTIGRAAEEITLLDIVESVEGEKSTFSCTEIRQKGPCKMEEKAYSGVCGIAAAMYRADHAWRESLRSTTLADINRSVNRVVPAEQKRKVMAWLEGKLSSKS
ncbi:MAG: Rrf2 family transcriptional regulator [Leptospiraceae bacterium]|nr:Rrf2 family transcriptional regulator [Leptospiraceae bacterium]MCB1303579.1 Rrf2 family transcriptional regulator [Leptospiraceae bacterium]